MSRRQRRKCVTNESGNSRLLKEAQTNAAAALLIRKTSTHKAALQQDNSQWTGENELEEIIRLPWMHATDQTTRMPKPG
jgi:hypothetical protein